MAKSNNQQSPAPTHPAIALGVVDIDAHERKKEEWRKEHEKMRPLLLDCLDPEVARRVQLEKPHFEYVVKFSYRLMGAARHPGDRPRREKRDFEVKVQGLNENDAWAHACDLLGIYPSRRSVENLEIIQGRQLPVAELMI